MCDKWMWMMEYCKKNSLPPAQSWAWKQAEEAYDFIQKPHKLHKKTIEKGMELYGEEVLK